MESAGTNAGTNGAEILPNTPHTTSATVHPNSWSSGGMMLVLGGRTFKDIASSAERLVNVSIGNFLIGTYKSETMEDAASSYPTKSSCDE